jgi:hypothetical protein
VGATTAKEFADEELGYPTESFGRLSSSATCDEEAAFRDTDEFTQFMGVELQPVEVVVQGELAENRPES